jgi:ankyrin repeat protein
MKKIFIILMLLSSYSQSMREIPTDQATPQDRLNDSLFRGGNVEEGVKSALDAGAKINRRNRSNDEPIFIVIMNGNLRGEEDTLKLLRLLKTKGANFNIVNQGSFKGETPLITALRSPQLQNPKKLSVIKNLINAGADINYHTPNDGDTPLIIAVRNGDLETIRLLLEKGAEINATDHEGYTALSWALYYGKRDIAKLLLDEKAIIGEHDIANTQNEGDPEMIQLLESRRIARPQHVANVALRVERDPQGQITDSKLGQFGLPPEITGEILKHLQ